MGLACFAAGSYAGQAAVGRRARGADRLIFAKRENNGGRDSGLAEDGHPTESRPGETQCFIFTFRENNRVSIFLLGTAKKF